MSDMTSIKESNDKIQRLIAGLKAMPNSTARELSEQMHVGSVVHATNLLRKLKECGVVETEGKKGRALTYKLNPPPYEVYRDCKQCNKTFVRWNLNEQRICKRCDRSKKGGNQTLDNEYAFLSSPGYQLFDQVFKGDM